MKNLMKGVSALIKRKIALWIAGLLGTTGFIVIGIAMLVLVIIIGAIGGSVANEAKPTLEVGGTCSITGELNEEMFHGRLENAGVFSGKGQMFIDVANEWEVDPVLLTAIAMLETGWGTSHAAVHKNNPGGLMINGGLYHFPTLKDGMRSMGKTLNTHVYTKGLTTIEEIALSYAPPDDPRDTLGTNKKWPINVAAITGQLGGLTMNCSESADIIGDKAWPVPYTKRITSGFGYREIVVNGVKQKGLHAGIDIASPGVNGQPAVSYMAGTVTHSGWLGGFGNLIIVDHGNNIQTYYGHLIEKGVPVGTVVEAGQPIGRIGTTGNSTAPHLHFEIRINGSPVNPVPYLTEFLSANE